MPVLTTPARRHGVVLMTATALAASVPPVIAHPPALEIEHAQVLVDGSSRALAGSILLHTMEDDQLTVDDLAGDALGFAAAPPGTDLLASTVRMLTPDLIEFTLRTTPADLVAPDGTSVTPGGTTVLYTWDIGMPGPDFQVQARRQPHSSRPPEFVLLSNHDGTTYTRETPFEGTFGRDSISWRLEATGNFAAVSGDAQTPLPTSLTVSNSVFLLPGGGPVPATLPAQWAPSDRIFSFGYHLPFYSVIASVAERADGHWVWHPERELTVVRGGLPGDVQRGRYVFSGELPAPRPGMTEYSVTVSAVFHSTLRSRDNFTLMKVCGDDAGRTAPCPMPQ